MAAPEDLTARARIRDAAIRLFADRGAEGTSVRDIAQEAGVSPGLLRHHFGSKEALREACDRHVMERAMKIKEELVLDGKMSTPGFLPSVHPEILLTYRYVTRALLDGSSAAASMFDDMVDVAEQWFGKFLPGPPPPDLRAYAAVMVGMQSGFLAMHEHVSRAIGQDVFTAEGHLRITAAFAEFYSRPLIDAELLAKMRGALEQARASIPPTAPAEDAGAEGAS